MSFRLFLLCLMVFVRSTFQTNTDVATPGLLGVNLGQSRITAAVFNSSGPVVLVDREASAAYQVFMTESLEGKWSTSGEETRQFLLDELNITVQNAREIGKDDMSLATITYPHHFSFQNHRTIFLDAANMFDPSFDELVRVRPTHICSMLTYTDDLCAAIHFDAPWDWEGPLVLLFEETFGRLRLVSAELNQYGAMTDFERQLSTSNLSESIRSAFHEEFRGYTAADVAAVILTNDSAENNLLDVEKILRQEYPSLYAKIKHYEIHSDHVNAVGAACMARHIYEFPFMLDGTDTVDLPDNWDADFMLVELAMRANTSRIG